MPHISAARLPAAGVAAARLGYRVGDRIVVSHGLGAVSFVERDDKPFRVADIIEKTGTRTFDPVWVTGTLKVTPACTGLAEAGYNLEARSTGSAPVNLMRIDRWA
jgi:hypothetical protein